MFSLHMTYHKLRSHFCNIFCLCEFFDYYINSDFLCNCNVMVQTLSCPCSLSGNKQTNLITLLFFSHPHPFVLGSTYNTCTGNQVHMNHFTITLTVLSIDIFRSFQNFRLIFQNCLLPHWRIPEKHLL